MYACHSHNCTRRTTYRSDLDGRFACDDHMPKLRAPVAFVNPLALDEPNEDGELHVDAIVTEKKKKK